MKLKYKKIKAGKYEIVDQQGNYIGKVWKKPKSNYWAVTMIKFGLIGRFCHTRKQCKSRIKDRLKTIEE